MEGPSRSTGFRQSRRSRSQRDRERRRRRVDLAEERATSLSSGSEREACGTNSVLGPGARECRPGFGRHRPPRRRKRESVSCEEDIIDGFAIASFVSLEALEMDCSLKPSQRSDMLGRRNKGKRGPEENGGGPLSEPEEGAPHSYSSSCWNKSRNKRRKIEGHPLETGYICDTESDTGDKASDNDMDPVFTVSTRKVVEPTPSNMGTSVGKICPPLPARCGGASWLMVTPRVSGLERSQEKSLEQNFPEPVSSSTSSAPFSRLPSPVAAPGTVPRSSPFNGNGSRHNGSPPLSKPKPFTLPGRSHSIYNINRSNTPVKPPSSASSVASSSPSMRPPTPSTSVSLPYNRGLGSSGPLRPPSRASSGALFTSSPGLPPPPPLVQGPGHSSAADQELLRQNLNPHFLNSQEREGRRSVPGAENNAAAAGRATPGGPSATSSGPGSSGRTSQNQPSIPHMAFQFHQHNHQHQHTHTHHFTPFLHPTATAPPLFDKYTGKVDGLYRHPFFPQYPPPSVPSIQPVIPPTGPFSSLQGAFQPKPLVPQGTGPDITARLGVVPHHLQPKDPRLTDPFGTSLKVSNKPGKWCAMHVYVAWMILSHQKKVKLMQAEPHKLDFRSDLLARLPGAGGLGPLGPMGGALPPTHDLTRPPSLFSAAGAVNPSSAPFISPSAPHSSFLTPTAHLDPYGRSPPFTPLGALGSGAFGGLGSPTLGSVFGPKDSPASVVGGLSTPNHHDPWNRLHGGQSGFPPGPSWAKGPDKRDERDRAKDVERRDVPHIKDEKDRDNMLYGRQPVRMSPVAPPFKPRSNTPVSHINGHSSALGGSGGPIEDLTRSLNRDRDRERDRDGDKRPLPTVSSRGPPLGSSSLVADRDRPRSSSSSVLTTPPPSNRSAPSPMDLYPRPMAPTAHSLHNEPSHSQRDGNLPSSSAASASVTSLSQAKKSDRTTTPVSKPPLLLPPVKVKEERKEEPEHIPITLPPPAPNHSFDRPNSHPHHPRSGTPSSSSLSLTPTPGVPLMPPTPNPSSHLSLLDRSRAIEAYLGSTGAAGLVMGPGGDRFHHGPGQGPSQGPHSFTWDPWRELAAQQQHQHRREALALRSDPHLALRSDPHLARLLQHQRLLEAERVAAVAAAAAAANPHHPPTSTSSASTSAVRQEFGLMAPHFDRPPHLGPPGGGLIDEEQRAQILREDFERARYFGMHPHIPTGPHLSSPSHAATAAHLEQLHPGLLSHSLPHGASPASQHHAGLFARLGHLNPHHVPNGILAKTPAGLVGALAVGAPPPLIPSITSRSSTPPRRLGGPGELALYSSHKDGESR
ncbi:autism susceptibility gene 2 protein homolog isoform X2 [Epinephelus lanceolatus]|uniref:autism susceptibility gene 2 protein homolog isoform X2 n=1 Tax=Epinephelus lanceolatus TaxID=310571 RepID=UPI001446277B|nr:autism susceptibility gene 2 protein homolog isoform X2 [Epinephelus lanceolatus]